MPEQVFSDSKEESYRAESGVLINLLHNIHGLRHAYTIALDLQDGRKLTRNNAERTVKRTSTKLAKITHERWRARTATFLPMSEVGRSTSSLAMKMTLYRTFFRPNCFPWHGAGQVSNVQGYTTVLMGWIGPAPFSCLRYLLHTHAHKIWVQLFLTMMRARTQKGQWS